MCCSSAEMARSSTSMRRQRCVACVGLCPTLSCLLTLPQAVQGKQPNSCSRDRAGRRCAAAMSSVAARWLRRCCPCCRVFSLPRIRGRQSRHVSSVTVARQRYVLPWHQQRSHQLSRQRIRAASTLAPAPSTANDPGLCAASPAEEQQQPQHASASPSLPSEAAAASEDDGERLSSLMAMCKNRGFVYPVGSNRIPPTATAAPPLRCADLPAISRV